jgi:hypothetical protein
LEQQTESLQVIAPTKGVESRFAEAQLIGRGEPMGWCVMPMKRAARKDLIVRAGKVV